MKKKTIVTTMMTAAMVLTMALPVCAYTSPENSNKDTTVTTEVSPTYTLTIPSETTIPFNATSTNLDGVLKVTGNVEPNASVTVNVSKGNLERQGAISDTLTYDLVKDGESFVSDSWNEEELRAESKEDQLAVTIDSGVWEKAKAGHYSGKLTFTAAYHS